MFMLITMIIEYYTASRTHEGRLILLATLTGIYRVDSRLLLTLWWELVWWVKRMTARG